MQSFEYYSPTEIVFGKGAEDKTFEGGNFFSEILGKAVYGHNHRLTLAQ